MCSINKTVLPFNKHPGHGLLHVMVMDAVFVLPAASDAVKVMVLFPFLSWTVVLHDVSDPETEPEEPLAELT